MPGITVQLLTEIMFLYLPAFYIVKMETGLVIIVNPLPSILFPHRRPDYNLCSPGLGFGKQIPVEIHRHIIITVHKSQIRAPCLISAMKPGPEEPLILPILQKTDPGICHVSADPAFYISS